MKLFGRGRTITDDGPAPDGKVISRITVDRVDRRTHKIKAYAVDRATGNTVYKLRYTAELNELACYYEALEYLQQFVSRHNWTIDGEPTTNITLPFVRTLEGKSGYAR